MKKNYFIIMLVAVSMSFTTFAGGKIKIKKALQTGQKYLDETGAKVKKACGFEIKTSFDKKSFKSLEEAEKANWAYNTLEGIRDLCKDEDYKAAIKESIKSVKFKYDASIKKDEKTYGNKFALKEGVLTVSYNKDTANMESQVEKWLENNL